jgi:RNA polymerase sigma factor for flagellar operon FliA
MPAAQSRRVVNGIPFVEALARRMASTMPHSIDVGDLVQDGVIGLIDAAHRFDEGRGIKFETFAERRIRGAMIDALRRDAWPRGVRRVRRELEAAREVLRRELGHEPSLADLAKKVGTDETRLGRTIVRIHTIESTSPLATSETVDEACLPTALVPSEPEAPDAAYERCEMQDTVRAGIGSLPPREQKVITLYYYGDVTMKRNQAAPRGTRRHGAGRSGERAQERGVGVPPEAGHGESGVAAASVRGGANARANRGEDASGRRQHHAEPAEALRGSPRTSARSWCSWCGGGCGQVAAVDS